VLLLVDHVQYMNVVQLSEVPPQFRSRIVSWVDYFTYSYLLELV
jgi:hypothetical protein